MPRRTVVPASILLVAVVVVVAPRAGAQTDADGDAASPRAALAEASRRYEAAEYTQALAVLDGVTAGGSDVRERTGIEQYRALCLLALGRDRDAEGAIERLVRMDPGYDVDALDASPSIKNKFREVRRRVVPAIAREEYEAGKADFDRKAYPEATAHLRKAVVLARAVGDGESDNGDLRTLAQGFLDLAVAASAAPARPNHVEPPRPNGAAGAAGAAASARRPPVIVDPVPVQQTIPAMSPAFRQLAAGRRGVVELVVDEAGRVTDARMRESIYPVYDNLLLEAARQWRYKPGTVDGRAVSRTVRVNVDVGKE